jgi:hypothetical protein
MRPARPSDSGGGHTRHPSRICKTQISDADWTTHFSDPGLKMVRSSDATRRRSFAPETALYRCCVPSWKLLQQSLGRICSDNTLEHTRESDSSRQVGQARPPACGPSRSVTGWVLWAASELGVWRKNHSRCQTCPSPSWFCPPFPTHRVCVVRVVCVVCVCICVTNLRAILAISIIFFIDLSGYRSVCCGVHAHQEAGGSLHLLI